MKSVIVYTSKHHGNTKKLVDAIAERFGVDTVDAAAQKTAELDGYDIIGFASGVSYGKYYQPLLQFEEQNLPRGKKVFFIHTAGDPGEKHSSEAKDIARKKECVILGTYFCRGYDTYGPFKLIGGIAKGHPTPEEIQGAVGFFGEIINNDGQREEE